jgi:hypothetical protein
MVKVFGGGGRGSAAQVRRRQVIGGGGLLISLPLNAAGRSAFAAVREEKRVCGRQVRPVAQSVKPVRLPWHQAPAATAVQQQHLRGTNRDRPGG